MSGQFEQSKNAPEQSVDGPVQFNSPLHSPLKTSTFSAKAEPPQLKVQDNQIEVPEISINGWRSTNTTSDTTLTTNLNISSPYQSLTLDAAGRVWLVDDTSNNNARHDLSDSSSQATGDRTYDGIQVAQNQFTPATQDNFEPAPRARQNNNNWSNYQQSERRVDYPSNGSGWNRDQPQYSEASNPISIVINAIDGLGKALWAMTPFRNSVNGGRLGCAASVSEVLEKSGYKYASSAGVGGLESQLQHHGWRRAPISQAAPGDVVMVGRSSGWRNGGGNAHVGIVGEHGSVYHNSSSRGQWVKDNLQARFGHGQEVFVLKPPASERRRFDPAQFEYNAEPCAIIPHRNQGWTVDDRPQPYSDPGGQSTRRYDDYRAEGFVDQPRHRHHDRYQQPYNDTQTYNQYPYNRYDTADQNQDMGYDQPFFRMHRRNHFEQMDQMPRRGRHHMMIERLERMLMSRMFRF